MKTQCDVIVVGGGASGLLCAVMLARKGVQVTVLEKNHRIGKNYRQPEMADAILPIYI